MVSQRYHLVAQPVSTALIHIYLLLTQQLYHIPQAQQPSCSFRIFTVSQGFHKAVLMRRFKKKKMHLKIAQWRLSFCESTDFHSKSALKPKLKPVRTHTHTEQQDGFRKSCKARLLLRSDLWFQQDKDSFTLRMRCFAVVVFFFDCSFFFFRSVSRHFK